MRDQIRGFVIESLLNGKAVKDTDDLLLNDLVDSIGVMRLIRFVEQTFQYTVPAEDVTINNFATIDTICSYLNARSVG